MVHLTDREGNTIDEAEARQALDDALQSSQFESSKQLSDFLHYIVEESLAGRASELKAYTIAVDALGKGEQFDPQDNAAVRVAAGRLRRSLQLHNAENSANEPKVVITLEAGSYAPVFARTDSAGDETAILPGGKPEVPAADSSARYEQEPHLHVDRAVPASVSGAVSDNTGQEATFRSSQPFFHLPTVAVAILAALAVSAITAGILLWRGPAVEQIPEEQLVAGLPTGADRTLRPSISATLLLPDKSYPDWFASGEVADSIAVTLARFDAYEFYGVNIASDFPASSQNEADYILLSSAYNNAGAVRIFVQLLRGRDGVILWSTQRLFPRPASGEAYDVPRIAGSLIAPLLSPYGVIFNDLRGGEGNRFALQCFILAYQYFYSKSDEGHAKARECSEKLRDEGSRLPLAYAGLTYLYLDEYREDRNRRDRDPIEAAREAAARAVELGPLSAQAKQAEFAVHKVTGHRALARKSGNMAVDLNPFNTDILSDYAAWLISIGDAENGREILEEAVTLLQSKPAWVDFYRFLGAELSRDLNSADEISVMMDIKRSPLLAVAVAIGAHRMGKNDQVKRALEELEDTDPALATNPMASLKRRGFAESIARILAKKLIDAGLPADPVETEWSN